MASKLVLQQLYPEFANMLRQCDMLRHMATQTPTDTTMRRARPYLAGLVANLLTVIRHINDEEPGHEFAATLQMVLKHCEVTEADIQWMDKGKKKLFIEGGFDIEKLRHFLLVAAAPIKMEGKE